MRFGPVPPAQALGSVLAHSLELNGTKLRKGLILKQDHLDIMAAADLDNVVVAQLDADDLHEDAAATRLAHALVPADTTLRLTEAFTGRVNLLAPGSGVALINEDQLNAANDVNPMITVATVPAYQQMSQRGMVATVKIIAYGVPAADLEIACDRARAAISFAPSKLRTATLIVTEIPGGAGEKGVQAIRDRLTLLGVSLSEVVVVPHAEALLADALASARTDLTLILTGSATSDPMDVAPQSVRLAGGQVERFGMPVDPGNLLFVGTLNDRPVIGLPGCARSPALNGADWVLSRIVCGLNVSHSDIARMGVGGLLKEIPTRPMPRQGRKGKAAEG